MQPGMGHAFPRGAMAPNDERAARTESDVSMAWAPRSSARWRWGSSLAPKPIGSCLGVVAAVALLFERLILSAASRRTDPRDLANRR